MVPQCNPISGKSDPSPSTSLPHKRMPPLRARPAPPSHNEAAATRACDADGRNDPQKTQKRQKRMEENGPSTAYCHTRGLGGDDPHLVCESCGSGLQ